MFAGRHHRRSAGAVAVIGLMTGGMAPRGVPAGHARRAGNGGRHPGARFAGRWPMSSVPAVAR